MLNEKIFKQLLKACKALQIEAAARGCGLRIADEAITAAEENPKITREFAAEQVERLAGMKKFPAKKVAVLKDMIDGLMYHNPDEEIVRKVMDSFARDSSGEDYCPSAGDIQRAIGEALDSRDGTLDYCPYCPKCSGTGFLGQGRCDCLARRKDKYKPPPGWLEKNKPEAVKA
jgi:hypothetical protein